MGIRAIGFLKHKDLKLDINTFLNKFREGLFRLGAFGFDSWRCKMENISNNNNNSEAEVKLITFGDSSEVIAGYHDKILIADSSFYGILRDVGLTKKTQICRIEGAMAQLGDFKVRYGTVLTKDSKPSAILFDIEYLPASLLTADFKALFDSVLSMMTESNQVKIDLLLPPIQENEKVEFSFKDLGELYFQVKDQIIAA
ncbi:hypothetical protein TRFO_15781 [Tritrichomonas foetus]|uniref:Mediator of RNA polymerase II transcription subunit 20 n=1 Tax=Tritrichomonas foetus TaxID=1144522 RepID=A0A1J4KSP1_9EUKA|nr:hypothetical protein TRFO_15781 [Tritrichomonas foetus]|eukprot:OHT13904.1 hypothetical protein TRFO_15781 [Tritrichomonas foetus]